MQQYRIDKPIRLIETFSGIGAQALALKYLGVHFENWITSDWDITATKAYHAIHMPNDTKDYSSKLTKNEIIDELYRLNVSSDGKKPLSKDKIARKSESWLRETYNDFIATHNVGSICNCSGKDFNIVDQDKYNYIFTYSWPCQAVSNAGLRGGMKKGSGTSSSLLWEIERLLIDFNKLNCLPNVLIAENVSAAHNKKNIKDFNSWLTVLDKFGYNTYWTDLNAKDYGSPQNRSRVFIVSILGAYSYEFPKPIPLKKCLKDVLEDDVPEEYYINNDKAQELIEKLIIEGTLPQEEDKQTYDLKNMGTNNPDYKPNAKPIDVGHCICARDYKGIQNFGASGVIENEGTR